MDEGVMGRQNSYLSEFSLVFLCSYLKRTAFMCRIKAQMEESLEFRGCGAIGAF